MNDVVIHGGWLVDGTGAVRQRRDVGIKDGLITEIGEPKSVAGRSKISAVDRIVCPGFIDVHTHYDAQLTWDPAASPSILHGVTTVLGGNCGFSLAPITDDSAEYLIPMLATVEGMPEEALREGLKVSWKSFEGYLDSLDETLAINAGFMVGHSALRRMVMGESAIGGQPSSAEMDKMVGLLHQSISAGALGFSTSRGQSHYDHNGDPVPSRHASSAEILALCRATGEHDGTSLEAIPTVDQIFDSETELFLVAMSLAARRPINWNNLTMDQDDVARASRLRPSDSAQASGGKVIALANGEPQFNRFTLERPFLWEGIPGWAETMRLPIPERIEAFRNPEVRRHLREGAMKISRKWVDWPGFVVNDVQPPASANLVGRSVGDIAKERGTDPFDTFCDIAVEARMRVGMATRIFGADDQGWMQLVDLLKDPRVVFGASDAGAHLDTISSFAMYTGFLGSAVRERSLLTFEDAVSLMTARPAALYGLKGRGTIGVGNPADVLILDETTIGHGHREMRNDLPGGAARIYSEPFGVEKVIVNGVVTVADGQLTGAQNGKVIRSGKDTANPAMSLV
jgi:N-acyl-D-aspartate/D-glutamate deacylase